MRPLVRRPSRDCRSGGARCNAAVEGGGVNVELGVGGCRGAAVAIVSDRRRSEAAMDRRWVVVWRGDRGGASSEGHGRGPEGWPKLKEDEEVVGDGDANLNQSRSRRR
jgi:hypothetical protein